MGTLSSTKTLTLLLLLCASTLLPAQVFDFAINGGVSMGQIDGDNSAHYNHAGYYGGVAVSFPLGNDNGFRLAVELSVIQKGSEVNNSSLQGRSISLHYAQLPLLLAYAFDFGHQRNLRLAAGLAPAFLYHAHVDDNGVDNPEQANNFRKLDLLPLCAEARMMLSKHWGIGLRYNNSLRSIAKESSAGTYRLFRSNTGIFNNDLIFAATYLF